ncbi:hypothetical protein P3607_11290 [Vibrio parahaemolyticus]|uniref:phage tail tube protein n=1 Tax=Vibrio TaxID=662 RepID=UPI000A1DB566|nr:MULTISPECIES: phage tail tube protein [Vibrio]MBE3696739.1 hypothetical protein [Vibrio parahaemolyticus]MBE3775876.1 hypothetical protein [Vibrio parahaemolyticus]MBN8107759.1 hypothetical protein [Vibrio vulnificus]MBN8112648.1 hypothetical protein [Vibrio vulnificus]MBX5339500.1 hypothetical protein [Vibrio parahaemolyticus]
MARKARKKVIAYATETTYGQDAIDGGTPKYLLGREFSITPMAGESTPLDYDDGLLGNSGEIVTELYVTVEFTVDLASGGAAATPAPWGDLMKACLRSVTTGVDSSTYAIDDTVESSLTLYFYQSGVLHKVTGARGSLSMAANAKNFGGITFSFSGLFSVVSASALPAADFTPWKTPLKIGVENSAFTIDAAPIKMISLEYDQANSVVYQEYVGHEEVIITDFAPTGTLVIEAPDLATFDPFAAAKAALPHALVFTNGPVGNQVEFSSTKVQLGRPTYADQDGTQTYSIPLRFLGNSDKFVTR